MDSIRPDLDGNAIMSILGVGPGPAIGQAYKFLLELRMEQGPLESEQAEAALRTWWSDGSSRRTRSYACAATFSGCFKTISSMACMCCSITSVLTRPAMTRCAKPCTAVQIINASES